MKKLFIIILMFLIRWELSAQVTSNISYDANRKVVTWTLTNHFDKKVQLLPNFGMDDMTGCWYQLKFKDVNKNVMFVYADYVKGTFISPKSSRSFKFSINENNKNIKYVDVIFHEDVYVINGGLERKTHWKGKVFTVTYNF